MVKSGIQTVYALCALALALTVAESHAISPAEGRAIFAQHGCIECHAYVARIGASSAKQMSRRFGGDVEKASAAYFDAKDHAREPQLAKLSGEAIRLISEWLAGSPAAPTGGSPQQPIPAVATPVEAQVPANSAGKAVESDRKKEAAARAEQKREAAAAAKRDAEMRAALKREADERARQAAAARARHAAEEQAALKREADEQARRAAEAKAKREADARAAQKREAEDYAKRVAEAKAKNDLEAQAVLKRDAEERARRAAEAKAKREAEEQALARREAEEQTKRAAEAKARREAEEQAALRREAEERAKREAESKARQEADARAKREAEARARKEAEAKSVARDDGGSRGKGKGGKAPDKFRDEPCPPISASASIGPVDEDRAKQIMERVDCSGCHAYVQKKTGPPMKRVYEKVKGNPECVIQRLKKNQEHNEEGVTDELKGPEFKIVADYLATREK